MTSPTPFTESNALLAVVEDDLDEARRIIATMLPGERHRLADAAEKLADLLGERDRILEALDSACRWIGYCSQASDAYYIHRDRPLGICQRHRVAAQDAGVAVYERPAEVQL